MTTSSSDHLRCLLLLAPKLLKSSHTLTAFPYLPLDLPSTYFYLPLPHCCTKTALAKVSEAHVSFNLLNTSWYLSCLILGCLKCHWQLRTISHFGFCGLAASSPSFHQSYGSPSSPFSVSSFSAHPWNMEVLQGSALSTYPWEVSSTPGLQLHSALCCSWRGLLFASVSVFSVHHQPHFWWQHPFFLWGPSPVLILRVYGLMGLQGWSCDLGLHSPLLTPGIALGMDTRPTGSGLLFSL